MYKQTYQLVIAFFLMLFALHSRAQLPNEQLWYDYPAKDWKTQALHLGNGYLGVSFYGGCEQEQFDIAEKTFWTGGPGEYPGYNYGIIPGGAEHIGEIRDAVVREDIKTADRLAAKYMVGDGKGFGGFSMVGKLLLDFGSGEVTDYCRRIDLSNSEATVEYRREGVAFKRTYFCSYPDKVFVVKLTAGQSGKLSFALRHKLTHGVDEMSVTGKSMNIVGRIKGNGMKYAVALSIEQKGGRSEGMTDHINVSQADEITIYYTVATEYRPNAPLFRGGDPVAETKARIQEVSKAGYLKTKEKHVVDYRSLYAKTVFSVAGDAGLEKLSTNQRWEQLKNGNTNDAGLKVLLYNLGRYLLISASRPGTLPSNLQGVWNTFASAPWNGNYQSNINLQMMYWGCGPTGLAQCQQAYNDWIARLVEPGRKVAQNYYGTKGWVSHSIGNPWMYAAPGNDILWGLFPSAAAWHCRSLWDYYQYTMDKTFLAQKAYPIIKEAAQFWLENLVEFKGQYIIAPSVSAEHGIELLGNGFAPYPTTNGEDTRNKILCAPAFQDIQMVDDLFAIVAEATGILGTDQDFAQQVNTARNKLMPQKTGRFGQLQEWYYDVDNPRDHHRHIAHLYLLFPGNRISHGGELADAARRTLDMRGDGFYGRKWPHAGGNWSSAWRIWMWARLGNGEKVERIFNHLVANAGFENLMGSQSNNMQVDASMSTPGFISEMLLQSHQGRLHVLPALPLSLSTGEITGLVARGGYTVDMKWETMNLTEITVRSTMHKTCPVFYKGRNRTIETNKKYHPDEL